MKRHFLILLLVMYTWACSTSDDEQMPDSPKPIDQIYRIPVVVHIIHNGEAIGEGPNLSKERIEEQIETLNEDYRRKAGTLGYNEHPHGADSKIEFFLAHSTPQEEPTDGIVRINQKEVDNPQTDSNFNYMAGFSYWDPNQYLNIWTMPVPEDFIDSFLGIATGPETDLPGSNLFTLGEPYQAEGVILNWAHFGISNINSKYNLGRTLTHEIGHYLGLLHTWGNKNCEENDFCEDTPAVSTYVSGSTPFMGCNNEEVMIGNYMNWSDDEVMNIFTNDQVARMHYVLENSPRRKSLLTSSGLPEAVQ